MTEIDAKIKRVFEIYQMLTGKPDPEQEEQAQKDLLQLFSDIKAGISPDNENFSIILDLHSRISKWDTLDKWFNEEKDLKEKMKEMLTIYNFISRAPSPESKNKPVPAVPAIRLDSPEPMKSEEEPEAKTEEPATPRMKVTFRSKLAAPEIKIPPVMAPKKKIAPSTSHIEAPVETPVELELTPQEQPPTDDIVPPSEAPNVPVNEDVSNVVNEIPRIKINMPSIKINSNPMKITMPKTEPAPEAKLVIKPVSPAIPQIRPMGSNIPQIKPVGPTGPSMPQIKPVSPMAPQIKPVGPSTPFIKPVPQSAPPIGEPTPMARPQIKAVNGAVPQFKPVGGVQKPFIQPISSGQQPAKSLDMPQPNPNPFNLPPSEKKPVNLFEQSKKSQNNLFNQKPKQVTDESEDSALKKISPLNKMDFQANAPMATLSADDEQLLKLPREDLYFELLRSEAKRFFFDKLMNKLQDSHSKGQIGEAEFRGAKERNNFELENEIKRINKIRGMILSVKSS